MRAVRSFVLMLVVSATTIACGSDGGSSGEGTETTQPSVSVGGGGGATETSGGGGSGANRSVTYEISGDYEASGELPFVTALSTFTNGGWVGYFGEENGDTIVQVNSMTGTQIINFGNPEVSVPGTAATGCTIDFTQNDADGFAGSFDCQGIIAARNDTGAAVTVDFNGEFDAHP